MDNDHQESIERLELMYKESNDQMLQGQNEKQIQIMKLMELIANSAKKKGLAITFDMGKEPVNPENQPTSSIEATQEETHQEH